MVLTVNPTLLPQMYNAVLAKANGSATFRAQVAASALRVLTAKAHTGVGLVRVAAKPAPAPVKVSYARYYGVTLRQGATGSAVTVLQRALGGLVADGDFGPATRVRVQAFEKAKGLPVDGVADRALWQVLGHDYSAYDAVTLRQGSTGSRVKLPPGCPRRPGCRRQLRLRHPRQGRRLPEGAPPGRRRRRRPDRVGGTLTCPCRSTATSRSGQGYAPGPGYPLRSWRAITRRWIWLVPS